MLFEGVERKPKEYEGEQLKAEMEMWFFIAAKKKL